MTRAVSAKSNLVEANKINKSPHKTKLHQYPDVMTDIRQMIADGKAKVQVWNFIVDKYKDRDLPSKPAFYGWIDKYAIERETVEVIKYTPQYFVHMEQFDAYKEMLWALREMKQRYLDASKLEANMPIKQRSTNELLVKLVEKSKEVVELEIRLGLRLGESNIPNVNLNQQNNTIKVEGRNIANEDELEELVNYVDESIAGHIRTEQNLADLRQAKPAQSTADGKSSKGKER